MTINPRIRSNGGGNNVQIDLTNGVTMSICVGYGCSDERSSEVAFWFTAEAATRPYIAPPDFPFAPDGSGVYGWVPHAAICDYISCIGYFLRDGFIISGIQKTPPKELMP